MTVDKRPTDHALAAFKAGISLVPVVGGALASLIGDYVPTSTQRGLEDAARQLAARLRDLENRIDPEAVDKEEFAELFKSSYLLIVRSHKQEKRRAAVNLLTNLLLRPGDPDKLSYTELDHFARSLDLLSSGALAVLAQVAAMAGEQSKKPSPESYQTTITGLASRMPHVDRSLLMGLVAELNALHLLTFPAFPTIRTTDSGNLPVDLTPLGKRFLQHILLPGGGRNSGQ